MMDLMKYVLLTPVAKPEERKAPVQPVQRPPQPVQPQKTEPVAQASAGATTINIYNTCSPNMQQDASGNNTIGVNNQSESNSASNATASAESNVHVDVEVEVSPSIWHTHQEQMKTFLDDNKVYFGVSALLALYSYYCYQVICGNFYLKRIDLWSSWKHELSFEQLCSIPQQALARDLILSIQHQGLDMQKPTDFTVPLVVFLQVIEQERTMLLYYQTLYNRITMVKCGLLFPFNHTQYNHIEGRLQRLSFVKNIFISWMAEFNLEHAGPLNKVYHSNL